MLLYLPWSRECTSENCNLEIKYRNNISEINSNRAKFNVLPDESLDAVFCDVYESSESEDDESGNTLNMQNSVDIFHQSGTEDIAKKSFLNRYSTPQRISSEEMQALLRSLNLRQKEFVMRVLHVVKVSPHQQLKIFLSGSAGVGKSTVTKALFQLLTSYYDNLHGPQTDSIKVLLCAFSGKAAYLINGVTLHTAFSLPLQQYGGCMPELSSDVANSIREKLINLKLLIIDEISMVSSTMLNRIDMRLRQVMGNRLPFGNIHVILVGDLHKIRPVMGTFVFKPLPTDELADTFFTVNPLWEEFRFYELLEVMRQKEEADFINALNNLATGTMTDSDIALITSLVFPNSANVPSTSIRLYVLNKYVDQYNDERLNRSTEQETVTLAEDNVIGKISDSRKTYALNSFQNKRTSDTGGLPSKLRLKLHIKYMITSNIDVEDGLVNGACGVLKFLTLSSSNTAELLWLDFSPNIHIGANCR